jgi:hypothetical protein
MLGGGMRRLRSGDFPLVLNPLGEWRDIRGGGGVERRLGDLDRIILKERVHQLKQYLLLKKSTKHVIKLYQYIIPNAVMICAVIPYAISIEFIPEIHIWQHSLQI